MRQGLWQCVLFLIPRSFHDGGAVNYSTAPPSWKDNTNFQRLSFVYWIQKYWALAKPYYIALHEATHIVGILRVFPKILKFSNRPSAFFPNNLLYHANPMLLCATLWYSTLYYPVLFSMTREGGTYFLCWTWYSARGKIKFLAKANATNFNFPPKLLGEEETL
jgi:hypothetical protein